MANRLAIVRDDAGVACYSAFVRESQGQSFDKSDLCFVNLYGLFESDQYRPGLGASGADEFRRGLVDSARGNDVHSGISLSTQAVCRLLIENRRMAIARLKVFRRYLAVEIYGATLFVFAAFLGLFAFFDLINELGDIGKGSYRLQHALAFVALNAPTHIYELFPIAVLIGSLYVLSRLAANSEYTVMRAAGLSPADTGLILLRIGIVFALMTFLFGELVAPFADGAA